MNIAFTLFKYFPFGGLQRDFRAIAEAALKRGYHIDIYTLEWQGDIPPGFNVHVVKAKGFTNHRRYWNFSKYIKNHVSKQDYDIVLGFNKTEGLDIYFAADPCYMAMAKRVRSAWYRWLPRYRYFLKLERAVFEQASNTKILAITKQQINDLMSFHGTLREQFYLLSPWITRDRIRPENWKEVRRKVRDEFNIPQDHYLLLLIGSGFKTKGLDRALHALHSLPLSIRDKTHFLVIGQDKPQPFMTLAKKLELENKITFLQGRTDVPNFLFAADIMVHPAYSETAGIVIIEATAAGLPCIVTDVCGYAHHVIDAKAGSLIPSPFNQETLNQTLYELLTASNNEELSQNGIQYCNNENFFNMPEVVVDLLEEIISVGAQTSRLKLRQYLIKEENFPKILQLQGQVYRELDGRKTLRFEHENKAYFAKIHYGVGWPEILKNLYQGRLPVLGAFNEYKAILRLKQLNVDTMNVVAFSKRGINPANMKSFIVTDELPNTISLEDFCSSWAIKPPSFKLKLALIRKVAQISRALHINGVNHRDFYICHFLLDISSGVDKVTPENLKVFLIDLHRVQVRRQTPYRWIVKDTGSLYFSVMNVGLTVKDIFRFMKLYQKKSLRDIIKEDKVFWNLVRQRGVYLYNKANKKFPELVER